MPGGGDGTNGAGPVASSPRVAVRLLGPPVIEVDGRPLRVDTRKAVALLAILAVEGGPQRRDRLASLLWPDSDPPRAAGAFRRTLSVLNSALGDGVLHADRRDVSLMPGAVTVDVARFGGLVAQVAAHGHGSAPVCRGCAASLEEAVGLHRADFLAGFGLRDTAEFEDWQAGWTERYRRELQQALDRLTRAEVELGALDAAVGHAERWLQLDPLNEQVHVRLMLLHARRGERSRAIQRYRDCVAILDRELGVRPLDRTTRLYRAVLEGRPERPETPVTGSGRATAATRSRQEPDRAVLVGRERELDRAERALRPGALLVVRGEAGIGRTRFVEELEARMHRQGAAVLVGRCHPDERGLSFGPVVDLVRSAAAMPGAEARLAALPGAWLAEASRVVPELSAGPAPLPPPDTPGAQARLLDALAHVLAAALPPRDLRVLVLGDVHHADDATLDLLSYLGHRLHDHVLALTVTFRDDAVPSGHALQRLATDDEDHLVLDLRRLDDDAVASYVRGVLGERPDLAALTARIQQEAEGLPLAVVEYTRWIADAGHDSADEWPIPSGVRELVRSRLDGLSDTARQVLTAAAIAGHDVDEDLLRRIAGRTEEETVAGLEELVERGLLRAAAAGRGFDLAHDRIRTVAYDDTNPARRRLLHARAADALAARVRARPVSGVAGVIAEHARLGGREEEAAVWSVRAGDHARTVFANAEALQHYEQALALGHPDAASVHARIARLDVLTGDYAAALASYETAAAHATDPLALAAVEHELGTLHLRRGSWALGRVHLEAALGAAEDRDVSLAARITADLALLELTAGDPDRAAPHTETALRLAEEAGDRYAVAQARNVAGLLARRRGRVAEAQRHLEHAAALASTAEDPTAYIAALNNLALTTADAGDGDRAVQLLTTALERCEQQGDRHRRAAILNNLADLHHREGDDGRSMELLKLAVREFAGVGEAREREPEIWKLTEW